MPERKWTCLPPRRRPTVPSSSPSDPPAPLGLDVMLQTWPFPLMALLPGVIARVHQDQVHFLIVPLFGRPKYGYRTRYFSWTHSMGDYSSRDLLSQVQGTIHHPRPEIWKLFISWCKQLHLDPVNCPVGSVLKFLQEYLSTGLTPSIIKVYVTAISASHIPLKGVSVGRHPLGSRFLNGSRWLRPICQLRVSSWDLALVLGVLKETPYEPLEKKCWTSWWLSLL